MILAAAGGLVLCVIAILTMMLSGFAYVTGVGRCGDGTDPSRPMMLAPRCSGPRETWRNCVSVESTPNGSSGGCAPFERLSARYDGAGRYVRLQTDRNSDGDVDMVRSYVRDRAGHVIRVETDYENDGIVDDREAYVRDAHGHHVRYDSSWATETRRYDSEGHLARSVRSDRDTVAGASITICEYRRGEVVGQGYDRDGDGRIDEAAELECVSRLDECDPSGPSP